MMGGAKEWQHRDGNGLKSSMEIGRAKEMMGGAKWVRCGWEKGL